MNQDRTPKNKLFCDWILISSKKDIASASKFLTKVNYH